MPAKKALSDQKKRENLFKGAELLRQTPRSFLVMSYYDMEGNERKEGIPYSIPKSDFKALKAWGGVDQLKKIKERLGEQDQTAFFALESEVKSNEKNAQQAGIEMERLINVNTQAIEALEKEIIGLKIGQVASQKASVDMGKSIKGLTLALEGAKKKLEALNK